VYNAPYFGQDSNGLTVMFLIGTLGFAPQALAQGAGVYDCTPPGPTAVPTPTPVASSADGQAGSEDPAAAFGNLTSVDSAKASTCGTGLIDSQ
jgi:hypothetical protein